MLCGLLAARAKGYDMGKAWVELTSPSSACPQLQTLQNPVGEGSFCVLQPNQGCSASSRLGLSTTGSVVGSSQHAHQRCVVGRVRSDLDGEDTGSQERVSPPGPQEAAYAYEHTDSARCSAHGGHTLSAGVKIPAVH